MPQETNLNVSPYFDDFDNRKNYQKVLLKPGYPIQARELNNLQSILQNQIEQFGRNVFKEGSRVTGCEWKYDNPVSSVQIESDFFGIPVSLYFNNLLGKKIRGSISGVTARIVYLLDSNTSTKSNYTLYLQYLESGGSDLENKVFQSGETLITNESISYGNFSIQSGQGFCNTIASNANQSGSIFSISSGIYFINGFFVNVNEQTIILDQYGINPSYRVGFDVLEKIVTSDEDETLYDNAQGFTNYAAPGADRFQTITELVKKDLGDVETNNFVEIFRVENGVPTFFDIDPEYNLIRDYMAKRTYDESGNFFVKPFTLFVRDCLNDRVLNNGIYFENQKTIDGTSPSEDKMIYQLGPGKAYVGGYDVEIPSSRLLEVKKTRTTEKKINQSIQYNSGIPLRLNRVYGSLTVGLGTDAVVSLIDRRIGVSSHVAVGNTIGYARIYDFVPETEYVDDTSRFELRLFDIQTFTQIGLNTSFASNLTTPTYIVGKKSSASGYLAANVSSGSTVFTLYQVSGKFLENEPITINGIDNSRLINYVKDYSLSDIKSIYSSIGISTFNADVILSSKSYLSKPGTTFKIQNGVVSVGNETTFLNIIKPGDIISYASTSFSGDPIYNRVVSVNNDGLTFTVSGITTVNGICNGFLPSGTIEVNNVLKVFPYINSSDNSFITKFNDDNIESLTFDENEILQRRTFLANGNGVFSGSQLSVTIPSTDTDIYFESFDEDRYVISYSNGKLENIRRDKFRIDESGKRVTFVDLSESSGNASIIATVKNLRASSKVKKINKVSTLVVDKSKFVSSGIGTTTLNDGLSYSPIYGLRVQDQEVSLNIPDVIRVLAIYESSTKNDPQLPTLSFNGTTGITNTNQDFNSGEWIVGQTSGATALVVNKIETNTLEYVYLNTFTFQLDEVILGKESKTSAVLIDLSAGDKNVTNNYLLDNGQRDTYYDYARIIRKRNVSEPTNKLKIIFQNYTIDPSDTGEFITVNSYSKEGFKYDVSYYNNSRLTDYIDIRPRVKPYTVSNYSPFEFANRSFDADGQYSKYILVPGENIISSYSYYVGRIDRIFLNSDGKFEVATGLPNSLVAPPLRCNSLDIATIYIPPYVYNTKNINVVMSAHKRYQMKDISLLEDRIQRVETFTTLSMLESKTENFTIKDAETGLDRFKCGFFVDNFSNHDYHDLTNSQFKSCIDTSTNTLRPRHYTTSIDLQLGSEVISGIGTLFNPTKDQSYVTDLGSPGVRKTGDLITLDYNETLYFEQRYATRSESVTPFLVRYWSGKIELHPPIDSWLEERAFTTTSFNEVTTTADALPDENITITNNVVVNRDVFVPITNTRTGIDNFDWITNARNILTGVLKIAGIAVDINNGSIGNTGNTIGSRNGLINNGSTLFLAVNKWSVTDADRALIRSLLPTDIAEQYITQIRNTTSAGLKLEFTPGIPPQITETTNTTTSTTSTSNTTTLIIPPEIITTDTASESISNFTEPVRFLRSRNIEFDVKGLRPVTKFYSFFEGIDVSAYIIPKLLEIEMISGTFTVGETVESDPHFTANQIKFRLASPNHRTGPFDGSNPPSIEKPVPVVDFATGEILSETQQPTFIPDVYTLSPYTQQPIPESYSESSTFLNVDTRSLQLPSEIEYYGMVSPNMRLIGKSSGAVAKITSIRLISDNQGRLIGSLYIPNPNIVGNPKWINGENTFTITDTKSLDEVSITEYISNTRVNQSSAEAEFSSSAIRNVTETNILTTRNITIIPSRNINTTTITNTTTNTTTTTQTLIGGTGNQIIQWETGDPLAQSFYVKEDTGIFLTSVEVFFETKDDFVPVTLQIRPMINGVPSNIVVPFSEVTLNPDQINLSTNATIPTKFVFPSPVYLPGPSQLEVRQAPIGSQQTSEFAVVLQSNSPQYRVFIAELGFNDIQTNIKLSAQPTLGSLFKSQNGTTWSAAQLEDLKYRLNRADFVSEGIVRFFNPELSLKNSRITVTGENQFLPLSKKIIVGLGSTGYNVNNVVPGVTIRQDSATAKLIGIGGSIRLGTSSVTISNSGFGYTSGTFSNVKLKTETGSGRGAEATIGVTNVGIATVTITSGGYGYLNGDSLLIPEVGMGENVGYGGRLTVIGIGSSNTFILDKVQGSFSVGISTLYYENSAGAATSVGPGVLISEIFNDPYYDGLHMKVFHMNHGMHSTENLVTISSMRPSQNQVHSYTTENIDIDSTYIPLQSISGFETFEGQQVSPTNPGYVIIGNEVIRYTDVNPTTLRLTVPALGRQVDGTQTQPYLSGVSVYKYEFNNISLRRINITHNFAEIDENHPIDINSYHIKINTNSSTPNSIDSAILDQLGTDRSNGLYFQETSQSGRSGTVISNNIQFEAVTPNFSTLLPSKTNLSTRIRTFSGTSVGGNEKSFIDQGFVDIPFNATTYFGEPKLICSRANERRFITESPGNKSLTFEVLLNTFDSRVSPVLDTIKTSAILTSNLLNNPLGIEENSDYANDDRVRSLNNDPHSAIYVSKPIRLKLTANALKVLLSASRNTTNDIRVLYQLYREDSSEIMPNFELFPGYSNYQVDGVGIKRVINPSLNDGSADSKVKQSSDRSFRDYEYSIDDLPEFYAFAIKIVMAGSNQATPPLIKQLRAIATIKPNI
jgi:hypothetical protein